MNTARLLAVLEVPHEDRVRCQAAGCNHSVFRRIHVLGDAESIHVYGSDCFKKLFGQTSLAKATPKYTSSEGRSLTDEERKLLLENTQRLIESFELEHQVELERIAARSATLKAAETHPAIARTTPPSPQPPRQVTGAARAAAEAQARRTLESRFPGVELDRPGFKGLLQMEIEKDLRQNADSQEAPSK